MAAARPRALPIPVYESPLRNTNKKNQAVRPLRGADCLVFLLLFSRAAGSFGDVDIPAGVQFGEHVREAAALAFRLTDGQKNV